MGGEGKGECDFSTYHVIVYIESQDTKQCFDLRIGPMCIVRKVHVFWIKISQKGRSPEVKVAYEEETT